jgi:hypothetical protein
VAGASLGAILKPYHNIISRDNFSTEDHARANS